MEVSFWGAWITMQEEGAGLFYHISDEEEGGNFMILLLLDITSWFSFGPEGQ